MKAFGLNKKKTINFQAKQESLKRIIVSLKEKNDTNNIKSEYIRQKKKGKKRRKLTVKRPKKRLPN